MAAVSDQERARAIGRYVLFGEIAAGGMATVHFGRLNGPVGFSRTVAVKRLHPQFAKDPEFVTMFLDEARLAGRIRHPNVVPTLDVVATEGEIFLVMEYVQGESLSRLARALRARGKSVPPDVTVTIIAGALHGLHAAHEAKDEQGQPLNIVHRDVSPQNVLVGTDGVPRVLDFGVAKAAGRLQTTREGQIKGKISYMAPEQLHGGEVTRQSDIYAAAVVLWETLAGRRLFEGDNEAMVLVKALEGKVTPPSELVPGLPRAFDQVVARGISHDPTQRFRTAREMAIALEKCGRMASPSEVGEWVEQIAGEELTKRAARIAEIESVSSVHGSKLAAVIATQMQESGSRPQERPPSSSGVAPSPRPDVDSQLSSISVSRSGDLAMSGKRRSRVGVIIAAGFVMALLGLVIFFGMRRSTKPTATPPTAAAPPQPPPTIPPPDPSPPAADLGDLPSLDKPAAKPLSTDKQPRPPPPKPAQRPAPPLQTQTPQKNCDPPFTIDAQGHKKYKMECMTR